MKGFERSNKWFSLCGLNCGLCPMYLGQYCPGCGGGEGNQTCAIARCSLQHPGVEYCWQCSCFPCQRYEKIDEFDSFITHRNRMRDMKKAETIGIERYNEEQVQKAAVLKTLLKHYNDGRKKTLFCQAVNLMELQDLTDILETLDEKGATDRPEKERAKLAEQLLKERAELRDVELKLRKKTKPKNDNADRL